MPCVQRGITGPSALGGCGIDDVEVDRAEDVAVDLDVEGVAPGVDAADRDVLDLGELGVADRWWDLGVATRAITWNYRPGLEGLFLAAYGATPDPKRQAFYRLLYDLAS